MSAIQYIHARLVAGKACANLRYLVRQSSAEPQQGQDDIPNHRQQDRTCERTSSCTLPCKVRMERNMGSGTFDGRIVGDIVPGMPSCSLLLSCGRLCRIDVDSIESVRKDAICALTGG